MVHDLTGKVFGHLTAISCERNDAHGNKIWRCVCECGNYAYVTASHLLSGHTRSCGCIVSQRLTKRNTTHGQSSERLYRIWKAMRQRCNNHNHAAFKRYGGRGIKVCDGWKEFGVFQEWAISHGYSDVLTIDRINNNGNYEPSNCRWVTLKEQQDNRSSRREITFNGQRKTLTEWSKIAGINISTLHGRLKSGCSLDRAFATSAANARVS